MPASRGQLEAPPRGPRACAPQSCPRAGTAPRPEALRAPPSPLPALGSPPCWVPPPGSRALAPASVLPPPLPPPDPRVRAAARSSQKPPERSEPGRAPTAPALSQVCPASAEGARRPGREGFSPGVSRQAPRGWGRRATRNAQPCRTQALGTAPREGLRVGPVRGSAETAPRGPPEDAAGGMDPPPPGQVQHPRRERRHPGRPELDPRCPGSDWATHRREDTHCAVSSLLILAAGPVQGPALLSSPFAWHYKSSQILPGHQSMCQSPLLTSVPELPTCWAPVFMLLALVLPTDTRI